MAHVLDVPEYEMLDVGLNLIGYEPDEISLEKKTTYFHDMYGASASICSIVFRDIQVVNIGAAKISKVKVRYFLMTLNWLKNYQTEESLARTFKIYSLVTIRKNLYAYGEAIQALKATKIVWPYAYNRNDDPFFAISVDGTHCPINEQRKPFNRMLYSHKLDGPGLAYEVGIDLLDNGIVWINGPFPAGETDLVIYRKEGGLKSMLVDGLYGVADRGYPGEEKILIQNSLDSKEVKKFKNRASARQEQVNSMIKHFSITNVCFRQPLRHHQMAFEAVCVLVQYKIEFESPLYDV